MIIQEPIKATISYALENFAYQDAIFLSERLHAEVATDESLFLLSNSYYRSGKANIAYTLLTEKHTRVCNSPQCLFLLSKCCFDLKKYNEALDTLTGPFISSKFTLDKDSPRYISREELIQFFGEKSSFVAQLLGSIYIKLDSNKHASYYYSLSLKINPFLWNSYEKLVQLDPAAVDSSKLFTQDNFEFRFSCGTNPLINLLNSNNATVITPQSQPLLTTHTATLLSDNTNTSHVFQTPQPPQTVQQQQSFQQGNHVSAKNTRNFEIATPYAVIKQSNDSNKLDVITPEMNGNWHTISCLAPSKNQNTPSKLLTRKVTNAALKSLSNNSNELTVNNVPANTAVNRNLQNYWESSGNLQNRHSFGVLQLDDLQLDDLTNNKDLTSNERINRNRDPISPAPVKKPYTRRNIQQDLDINMDGQNSPTGPLRRSSRLFSHSNWGVKENTTANTKTSRTPAKRSRLKSFEKNDQKDNDLEKSNENLKVVTSIDLTKAGIKVQRTSAIGLLELMAKFGSAYKLLYQFKCKDAIEEFLKLPQKHLNTGFVLSAIGRSYFEMSKYDEAIMNFKKCRQLEPYRLQGMEFYSTALWHQQKEVELTCLAQTMIEFDKLTPETWCVAGNCFSLQKEHELSIKFLKRAIQLDPDFAYAYTLLGHELVSADELDNAMACFRNATRIEPRHYNAWYGIGMIFYKQEKYGYAYNNYKRAHDISPLNPILMCHLAIVCHHMKKSARALELLEAASKQDPNNALVKFHRASIYFATDKYQRAMEELEQLKQIVPKESMVYFLIGKIHKINGDTHLALMNFSWAMDLDPKGASNQIKELIDRHYGNEDEIMIHTNNANTNGSNNGPNMDGSYGSATSMIGSANNSASFMIHTPLLQRSTLTPTGPGAAGPSGGGSTQGGSNGSNSSNNISNNSTVTAVVRGRQNPTRRYIIREYDVDDDGEMDRMIDEEEEVVEEEEEVPEDVEEAYDDSSELAESSHMDDGAVSFGLDNSAEETSYQDDHFML